MTCQVSKTPCQLKAENVVDERLNSAAADKKAVSMRGNMIIDWKLLSELFMHAIVQQKMASKAALESSIGYALPKIFFCS
jgi:hypothetical protein